MNTPPTAVIELRGIVTRFGRQVVHDGIDLRMQRGEVLGLVGGSGSGKTTLLREMIGLQRPSEGTVIAFGESLLDARGSHAAALRQRWGVLFQHGALFTALTVADNIALPLRELRVLDEALIRELVRLKLAMVGLKPEDGRRYPAELSGGMIKRVGLARALALDAELLLLDEPTSGLDPVASELFVDLIAELRTTLGLTVALVTHDLDTLVDLCDRIAVLADRKLIVIGTLEEVVACDHPFIQSYFHGHRGGRLLDKGP
ncbi:ABC transporter ATP-binding protein [Candidatus Macondimonas diazotrophica]|jgi:phospholipid/cholesterol/gamma-HCH transport system ATP-binding protein|uniref:ATP-binding cassette domain-containing protein n=1 Tax=Candidatus Macondimonas diazotrophica TaxID=2305248 RepID=A0A4Z0FCF0_9GAMM|nr:ATP-binding cassette domain-containing protein [Candidatus Macondimonas diazotrophica]NCU01563.1 ATP-binding cassette domain-containing protein [Candidatus Macondimonas diazotrophica]TFZ84198.1 ATP-binding cassette domain-containing protein [Candidatus Macondimonas diazotrophica]HBG29135.1 ABC transporter ATP-binding protein [Gammaproteobacteria bacterium]